MPASNVILIFIEDIYKFHELLLLMFILHELVGGLSVFSVKLKLLVDFVHLQITVDICHLVRG